MSIDSTVAKLISQCQELEQECTRLKIENAELRTDLAGINNFANELKATNADLRQKVSAAREGGQGGGDCGG